MFLIDMSTIVRFSHVFMNRSLVDSDITSTENYILMYLFSKDNITQDEIADYYAVDKGSISKMIRSLQDKGYISKTVNPENRRENRISLTESGRSRFAQTKSLFDRWHKEMMKGITIEEFHSLVEIISKMAVNAKKAIELE